MPNDVISTLALRVSSGDAINNLRAVARESEALGGVTDQLKGKILSVVSAYASWRFGKALLADAAEGQEAAGKFEAVMGRYTGAASKAVDELNKNFNFSKTAAQAALSGMVDTFKKSGIETAKALDWSSELTKLAADLEAFTNAEGGVQHISEQLQSALLGNNMAVRSLGIILSEEAVQAQMAADKTNGLNFKEEKSAKMFARKTLILQQSAAAMGQVARESDNYSNRLRYLNARIADLRGSLGEALIPIMTTVVDKSANLVEAINNLSPGTKNLIVGVGALTGALLTIGPTVLKVAAGFKTFTAAKALETIAAQKETSATVTETEALAAQAPVMSANLRKSESITVAKNAETLARRRNAKAILAENLALSKSGAGKIVTATSRTGKIIGGAADAATAGKALSPGRQAHIIGQYVDVGKALSASAPVAKKFGSSLLKVTGALGSTAAGIGLVITALEAFKHAPQWIEVAFDKVPSVFAAIGEKTIEALKKAGPAVANWGKDLVVGGILGFGQTMKRLVGMETAASREYKLNKQIEENNKKRAALQAAEAKQRAAEGAVLSARNAAEQAKTNARLEINDSRETESVKLQKAIALQNEKAFAISHAENSQTGDKGGLEQQLAKLQSDLASGNLSDEQREEITEKAKQLSEELSSLREEWKNATLEVDKLSESAENAAKAFDENQKEYDRAKLSASEGIADANAQLALDSANSHQARQNALQNQRDKAKLKFDESVNAQDEADALNDQLKTVQGQLNSEKAAQALATLGELAQSGDTSEAAMLQYSGAQELLKGAGYGDIVEGSYGFGAGSAMNLLRDITNERKRQQKELDSLLTQRDEKQELANEAGSRLSAYNQAQRAIDDESKAFAEQRENERRQNEENERRRARANRSFQNSINETYFARQLQASDQFYGKDALGAAMSRYNLIGGRGSLEWSSSMSAIAEQQKLIDEINKQLEPLNKQFNEGTLTDEDAKERERLLAQRAQFEEEMQSDYQSAVMKRLQTEDSLLGLESTMREEYLKNIQNYVNDEGSALRERLQAEAEFEKKRMEELSKVQEEARQAVSGQRAISAGSSEAFNLASKIYDRGRENLPTEKKIENSTKQIEEYVKVMQEQMLAYFTEQSGGMTLAFSY